MTKKEIVKQISEELGLTQLKVKEIVQMVFDSIIDTLIEEERIELRNFGVFEVKKRAARTARNPRTGAPVSVPAKFVVTFKPGKTMEERVLELEQRKLRGDDAAGESESDQTTDRSTASATPDQTTDHTAHNQPAQSPTAQSPTAQSPTAQSPTASPSAPTGPPESRPAADGTANTPNRPPGSPF